jgi:hypothetical protein
MSGHVVCALSRRFAGSEQLVWFGVEGSVGHAVMSRNGQGLLQVYVNRMAWVVLEGTSSMEPDVVNEKVRLRC